METIFEHPSVAIYYDEQINAVLEEWRLDFTTQLDSASFKNIYLKIIETTKTHQVKKWYCDLSEQKAVNVEDQLWQEEHFYPAMLEHGLQVACLVDTKNILGTVYTKNCLQNAEKSRIMIQVFNDRKQAKEWLAKVDA